MSGKELNPSSLQTYSSSRGPRLTGGITFSVAPPPLSLAFNQGPRSVSSTSLMSLQSVPLWNSPLSNSKEPLPPSQVWTINDASADSQPPVAAPPRLHSQGPSFCGLRAVSMQFPLLRRQKTLTQPRAEREPGECEMRQFCEPSCVIIFYWALSCPSRLRARPAPCPPPPGDLTEFFRHTTHPLLSKSGTRWLTAIPSDCSHLVSPIFPSP